MSKVHEGLPTALSWPTSVRLAETRRCRIKKLSHAGGSDAC